MGSNHTPDCRSQAAGWSDSPRPRPALSSPPRRGPGTGRATGHLPQALPAIGRMGSHRFKVRGAEHGTAPAPGGGRERAVGPRSVHAGRRDRRVGLTPQASRLRSQCLRPSSRLGMPEPPCRDPACALLGPAPACHQSAAALTICVTVSASAVLPDGVAEHRALGPRRSETAPPTRWAGG